MAQPRVQRGVPQGGQYASFLRDEASAGLIEPHQDAWQDRLDEIRQIQSDFNDCFDDHGVPHSEQFAREAERLVIEAGELIDAEITDRIGPPVGEYDEEALQAAKVEAEQAQLRLNELRARQDQARSKGAPPQFLQEEIAEAELAVSDASAAWHRLGPRHTHDEWLDAQAAVAREILAETRDFGDRTPGGHQFHKWGQKPAIAHIQEGFDYFPSDWVAQSSSALALTPKKTRARAHYVPSRIVKKRTTEEAPPEQTIHRLWGGTPEQVQAEAERIRRQGKVRTWSRSGNQVTRKILSVELVEDDPQAMSITYSGGRRTLSEEIDKASEITTDGSLGCTIHELSHRMEHVNPRLATVEEQFYLRRTRNEDGTREARVAYMGRRKEPIRPDGFVEGYIGRDYSGFGRHRAFEVLSVGMEAVFCKRYGGLAGAGHPKADLDHRAFVLGSLAVA